MHIYKVHNIAYLPVDGFTTGHIVNYRFTNLHLDNLMLICKQRLQLL